MGDPIPFTNPINAIAFILNPSISTEKVSLPFDNKEGVISPMAPLVTAVWSTLEEHKDKDVAFIRITVFINSEFTIVNPDGPQLTVARDDANTTDFYVFYEIAEQIPNSYTAWYFEFYYQINKDTINKDIINVFNFNIDPKTSRGTTTSVGSSVGDF